MLIVNETMARKFWPGEDPVGRTFFDGSDTFEVVGVARDTKYRDLREPPRMTMYRPLGQFYRPRMNLLVRTAGAPYQLLPAIRTQLRSLDSTLPVYNIRTLPEHIGQSLFLQRLQTGLLSVFGALALALAAVGVYGVMAYTVAQRSRELGIRMALGAQKRDLLRLVLGQGLRLVLAGILSGAAVGLALTKITANLLYGVSPADPLTYAVVALGLALAALGACYLPARRAARVDPMAAPRYE